MPDTEVDSADTATPSPRPLPLKGARESDVSSPLSSPPSGGEGGVRGELQEKFNPVSFLEIFGNSNPVEIEIGCGKGKFLVARAQENPGVNFLGIDRVGKWMKRGITRAGKRNLSNLRFLRAEARKFIEEAVSVESISVFHIYFPDPWPKRRHQKRRVVNADLLRLLHSRLVPGGLIEVATDDADYFTAIKRSVAATEELWDNVREAKNERILDSMNRTNYEIKWASQGRELFYMELRKR